jgi:hypothetical protein
VWYLFRKTEGIPSTAFFYRLLCFFISIDTIGNKRDRLFLQTFFCNDSFSKRKGTVDVWYLAAL